MSPPASVPATPSRPAVSSLSRKQVLRSIAKYEELFNTHDLGLLTDLLRVSSTDVSELTAAVLTASAKDARPLVDAVSILDTDPVEAGVGAVALGRPRLRAAWKLFAAAGLVPVEMPASDAKAAIALVRAIGESDMAAVRARFDRTSTLLRKS